MSRIQIKICGLTRVDEAVQCADLGVNAAGFVFYERSPRNITEIKAKTIIDALPEHVTPAGVFVDEPYSAVMRKVERCGIRAVQLHGHESPELVDRFIKEGLIVIKGLFAKASPGFDRALNYRPSAFLLECGKGTLPGGNAMSWDWESAKDLELAAPLILAGGLNPENVGAAVEACDPDAVDVSSGVEIEPGKKDMEKVRAFVEAVAAAGERRAVPVAAIFPDAGGKKAE